MSLRRNKVEIKWSPNFAYAMGLIVSDGCVSKDGRHILFVSKDEEQIHNYLMALNIVVSHGITHSGHNGAMAYRIQFSDVSFWEFLNNIGIHQAKSKTIGEIGIPNEFFFDFVRGVFDGDGCIYSYWDKRWKSSFMFYVSFASAGQVFIEWMRSTIEKHLKIKGHISTSGERDFWQLRYAKAEAKVLINKMYESIDCIYLSRKKLKINRILGTMSPTSACLEEDAFDNIAQVL